MVHSRAHQKSSSVITTLELFVLLVRETHKRGWIRTATTTTAAYGQRLPRPGEDVARRQKGEYREELLGPRPAGCKARLRAEADAGSRNPSLLLSPRVLGP